MKTKLISLLLALVTSAGTIFASNTSVDGIWYVFYSNNTAYVTYRGSNYEQNSNAYKGSVTIPSSVTYNGITYRVTGIGEHAFIYCSGLKSITIPNGVTYIGETAFFGCSGLTSIEIPNSVTRIGDEAFLGCSGLTSITIPESVTSIRRYTFNGCSGLTSIEIPNSVTSIGEGAFFDCSGLTSIEIPNSVTRIGEDAFSRCSGLTSVTIGNNVTSIDNAAFNYCTGLTNVTIGNSVTYIGNYAFAHCSALMSIEIPNNVTSIGEFAFEYCSGLTNPVYNAHIFAYLPTFYSGAYIIPDCIESIAGGAFYNCTSLTSVTIPNSVTYIGWAAFYKCSHLTSIYAKPTTPPVLDRQGYGDIITFDEISPNAIVYIPFGGISAYHNAYGWKQLNLQGPISQETILSSTSCSVYFSADGVELQSCGIEGGEQQAGNTLEYVGLEPNSEYKDLPIVLISTEGVTDIVNLSFTTSALELTTQPCKPVSSTTAILLAQTNIADIETSCGFEYKRNDAPEEMPGTKVYCPVANGQMAGRLKNLKDDVYYKYRAFYQSAAGNMYYGDWQYIFTGDIAVEFDPILYTYAATVVQENEATITGYALAGSEDFTEQGFEYWAESRNSANNGPAHLPAALNEHFFIQASGIRMTVTLTNLDAGTNYKYRAYGKVDGQYYYGSEQSFTTQGEYVPAEAIENTSVEASRATKILRNGQVLILRGDKTYTITGQEIK